MPKLDDYVSIVGQSAIDDIKHIADKLKGKVIQNINSTSVGGGVAEILSRMIPLLNDAGVDARWDLIKGGEKFYLVTKKIHNLLHGRKEDLQQEDFLTFLETSDMNIKDLSIYGDIVFVHDPQPVALIKKKKNEKWIWRCHIDISNPNAKVWQFLKQYVEQYDASVFSAPAFCPNLPFRKFLIPPSIDPLSDKNKELPPEIINKVLTKYGIESNKPIITQISRFDRLKDPLGVIEAFLLVRKRIDCQLILAGGGATDDPEGFTVLEEVREKAKEHPDIHVLLLPQNDIEVNALQQVSNIIVQKSIKEGFGLTVAEALWKSKPVVASNVGGIPLQIKHNHSGLLCYSIEGAAYALKMLLHNPAYAKKLGEKGHEHIKNNFLITRHIMNYLLLFLAQYHSEDIIYL